MTDQFTMGYALLIGVDENKVASMALPTVARDVAALQEVLVHPQRCAYPKKNVKTITGAEATRAGILAGLDWLHEQIEADTSGHATAVVYYTGHGWRDQAGDGEHYYLIPYDLQERHLGLSALPAVNFAEAIDGLRPRRLLVILDCCHAGGMGAKNIPLIAERYAAAALPPHLFMRGEKGVDDAALSKGLERLAQGSGRAVLSSSQGSQLSYLRRDKTMSIFTYHLIEALTGHAQIEGAKEVLVSDVMGYVFRKVPDSARLTANDLQEPGYQVSGNFPVALLLGGKGLSKGQPAPDPLATSEVVEAIKRVDTGGGAFVAGNVNTGGGDFVGRDKVVKGDEVRGDKVRGDQFNIQGGVSGSGIAIGRGARATVNQGINARELENLFVPLLREVRNAPPEKQQEAAETIQALKEEAAQGSDANDTKMAALINDVVDLIPGAVSAVVSIFATPLLSGLAGEFTRKALSRLERNRS